jgi:uncharacterized membrane protein YfcA
VTLTPTQAAIAFTSAFVAGIINSIAGGGTLVSFPALVWLGLPSVTANATSTVAIWPGTVGGVWGYRRELSEAEPRMLALTIPSLVGGALGAILLQHTSPGFFDQLVPFLIAFATILFMLQDRLKGLQLTGRGLTAPMIFQFLVALYGGFFGAGIGILMLAALSILGMSDIHRMNALKNFFALCINGIAAFYFVWARMVEWQYVAVMAAGAIIGGYGCAGVARKLGRTTVRRIVIGIGWSMAIALFVKKWA